MFIKNGVAHQYWQHMTSKETYAVKFDARENDINTALGPLPIATITRENLHAWNFSNETEATAWVRGYQEQFKLLGLPFDGDTNDRMAIMTGHNVTTLTLEDITNIEETYNTVYAAYLIRCNDQRAAELRMQLETLEQSARDNGYSIVRTINDGIPGKWYLKKV